MKKFTIMIICLVMTAGISAQEKGFTWGVKAGVNLANVTGMNSDMKVGFNAGIATEFGLTEKFAVGPELVYSLQGASAGESKLNASYINLPIMAKYYVIKGLSINLGPQLGYVVSMKSKMGSTSVKADKSTYNSFDFGIGVGATYHIQKFLIDARYTHGLTNVAKGGVKNKNSVIQLGVGYMF